MLARAILSNSVEPHIFLEDSTNIFSTVTSTLLNVYDILTDLHRYKYRQLMAFHEEKLSTKSPIIPMQENTCYLHPLDIIFITLGLFLYENFSHQVMICRFYQIPNFDLDHAFMLQSITLYILGKLITLAFSAPVWQISPPPTEMINFNMALSLACC